MYRFLSRFACALLAAAFAVPGQAQQAIELSDEAQISLLTILPGDEVYAAWGHSAFRVYDPAQDIDWAFNYGTFDFSDPFFLPRFVNGQLDYMLSVEDYPSVVRAHRWRTGRPIIEQVLDLDAEQRDALFRFLQTNARPENRGYRYDFLFDNCATRPRDVLRTTLGDALTFAPQPDPQRTFRSLVSEPWVEDRSWLELGFDVALGTPVDRVATPDEVVFLPLYLAEAADYATVERDGARRPLVARRDTVFWVSGYELPERGVSWPSLLFWTLFGVGLLGTVHLLREEERGWRWPDVALFLVVGLFGVLFAYLWFGSEHYVTNFNWNLLWAWPTHLLAAPFLARRRHGPALRGYLFATALVGVVTLLGWPLWPQPLPLAVLPLVLLLVTRSLFLLLHQRTLLRTAKVEV